MKAKYKTKKYKAMVLKEHNEAMKEAEGQERYTTAEVDAMLLKIL